MSAGKEWSGSGIRVGWGGAGWVMRVGVGRVWVGEVWVIAGGSGSDAAGRAGWERGADGRRQPLGERWGGGRCQARESHAIITRESSHVIGGRLADWRNAPPSYV